MNANLSGEVTVLFIRGGISAKGKPYLQVSNGRAEFFVDIPKGMIVDSETFAKYEENDEIVIRITVLAGSDRVKLVSLPE